MKTLRPYAWTLLLLGSALLGTTMAPTAAACNPDELLQVCWHETLETAGDAVDGVREYCRGMLGNTLGDACKVPVETVPVENPS